MTTMRALRCGALTLEPQTREHAEAMFGLLSDAALYEHEGEAPASVEWLRARFARLESRVSPDGREQWLNWVVRHEDGELIGYVQATIVPGGDAMIAYVFGTAWQGRGHAARAVEAMNAELRDRYGVLTLWAVFKTVNIRSRRLLERLGFGEPHGARTLRCPPGESVLVRSARPA